MSNTKLETIQFHDQQLIVLNHQNKPYIAMKPICENIGLDWHAQRQRIHRHHVLSKGEVMITLPSKSGNQEYVCLPISMINGWLFGIETSRVKPEIRATLEQYQLECFDVLYNHFMPNKETHQQVLLPAVANIPHEGRWVVRYIDGVVEVKNIDGKVCIDNMLFLQLQKDSIYYRNKLIELNDKLKQFTTLTNNFVERTKITSGECSVSLFATPLKLA
jgi:hypothetical protein